MLMLLVVLVAIGLLSLVVIPDQTTITLRENEIALSQNLCFIRSAIVLERIASDSSFFYGDFDNQAEMITYLDDLVDKGYLSTIPKDPLCPNQLWGIGPGKKFWVPTRNLLGSSSFETNDFANMPWVINETNVAIELCSTEWPGKSTGALDHFPYQNLFGAMTRFSGKSLAITQR